jgi:hypothetical protein
MKQKVIVSHGAKKMDEIQMRELPWIQSWGSFYKVHARGDIKIKVNGKKKRDEEAKEAENENEKSGL